MTKYDVHVSIIQAFPNQIKRKTLKAVPFLYTTLSSSIKDWFFSSFVFLSIQFLISVSWGNAGSVVYVESYTGLLISEVRVVLNLA